MVYVDVHYELGLHMITFLPQQPPIYDLTQESPFSWMIRTFNASGTSDMFPIQHASSFSSCFLKHLYSLSDLGVKYGW